MSQAPARRPAPTARRVGRAERARGRPSAHVTAPWAPLQPIPSELPPVPRFTTDLLPTALAPWVTDIAERAQCPMDFVAIGAVVAAAAVIGRQIAIRPKRT